MSYSVSIEIGDDEYEVNVTSIYFGQEPRGWDPGAGAEIELGPEVWVWKLVDKGYLRDRKIPMAEFLKIYAEHLGTIPDLNEASALRAAEIKLEEFCIEDVRKQVEDDYDDSDV